MYKSNFKFLRRSSGYFAFTKTNINGVHTFAQKLNFSVYDKMTITTWKSK